MKSLILITSLLTIASMITTGQVAYVQHNSFSMNQNKIDVEHYTVPIEVSNILNDYVILEVKDISEPEKFIKRVDDINLYSKFTGYDFKVKDKNGTVTLMAFGRNTIIAKDLLFRILWLTILNVVFTYAKFKPDSFKLDVEWYHVNYFILSLKYKLLQSDIEDTYGQEKQGILFTFNTQNRITKDIYTTTNLIECNIYGCIFKGGDVAKL